MAYIGNTVQNQGFTPAIDYFNGNGVTVTFTLSRPVVSVAQMIVAIDNVIQNPSSAFSVSGNSITFTSAPLSGTNNIWVEYTSLITQYNAISQDPSVIGDITATGGYLAEGDFGNTFIDGTIVDYVTGNSRITTGPADGMTFYNGGTSGRTPLLELGSTGNINIPGTGKRITGDFSNATLASRVMFQTSTTNQSTLVNAIPNGTNALAEFRVFNNSDPTNAGAVRMLVTSTEATIRSDISGTGTFLPLTMYTSGSERLRIDTSGNVGIGTTTPRYQTSGAVAGATTLTVHNSANGGGGIELATSSTTTTAVAGRLAFTAAQNTDGSRTIAFIDSLIQGSTSGLQGGSMRFAVKPDNAATAVAMVITSAGNVGIGSTGPVSKLEVVNSGVATLYIGYNNTSENYYDANTQIFRNAAATERMRIDSSGNLLVGTTDAKAPLTVGKAPSSSAYGQIAALSAAAGDVGNAGISVTKYDNNTTTSQVFARFLVNQGSTASGQINANGASAAAFGAYSDARLKQNIVDLPSQLANIMALRPVEFDYKAGGHQIGFIAQEVNEIYPDLVGEDEDGMLTLTDMNKNDARLIKAIQELKSELDSVKAELAILKGAA